MHVANQPYNVLDGAGLQKDGRSADSLARLNKYTPVLRSYCAKGDPICTKGDDVSKHLNYFELYTDDASTWAVGKINEAAPLCVAPTPTPSASSSVVASSVGAASATALASSSAAASSTVIASSVGVASSPALASSAALASSSAAASVSVAAGSVSVAAGSASAAAGSASVVAASASVAALPSYPTSPVHPAPFPVPQSYELQCLPTFHIEYVYV
jgi:hypothetical protein